MQKGIVRFSDQAKKMKQKWETCIFFFGLLKFRFWVWKRVQWLRGRFMKVKFVFGMLD